jgi:serine/threonine-protein kinase RsbW
MRSIFWRNRMEIREKAIDENIMLLEPIDDIDLYNCVELRDRFIELRKDGTTRFIIDLTNVRYIDSSGIGALVFLYTTAKARNIGLCYTNLSVQVFDILEKTGLHEVLPIAGNHDQAVNRLLEHKAVRLVPKQLLVDESSPLFGKKGMEQSELHIGFDQIRRLAALIAQKAPPEIRDINILEQQISELIKNGIRHGNKNDSSKALRIWYSFSINHAHVIIEDEGEGFARIEEWNRFYAQRTKYHEAHDHDGIIDYLSYRTQDSREEDGGNAMFAAVEYWNCGVVFNEKRNCVAVKRIF